MTTPVQFQEGICTQEGIHLREWKTVHSPLALQACDTLAYHSNQPVKKVEDISVFFAATTQAFLICILSALALNLRLSYCRLLALHDNLGSAFALGPWCLYLTFDFHFL